MQEAESREKRLWVRVIEAYFALRDKLDEPHKVNRKNLLQILQLILLLKKERFSAE